MSFRIIFHNKHLFSNKLTLPVNARAAFSLDLIFVLLLLLISQKSEMGPDDDGEDNEVEPCRQHPESCWEGVETQLVQSGVERSGYERKDSLEEGEDGEGSPHLLTAE